MHTLLVCMKSLLTGIEHDLALTTVGSQADDALEEIQQSGNLYGASVQEKNAILEAWAEENP